MTKKKTVKWVKEDDQNQDEEQEEDQDEDEEMEDDSESEEASSEEEEDDDQQEHCKEPKKTLTRLNENSKKISKEQPAKEKKSGPDFFHPIEEKTLG